MYVYSQQAHKVQGQLYFVQLNPISIGECVWQCGGHERGCGTGDSGW